MGLNKEAMSLLLSYGSVEDIMNEYLADVAMFTLRKLPSELQRQATVDQTDGKAILDADGMEVTFTYDQQEVRASVRVEPNFSYPVARRGFGEVSFSIGLSDSGIKLVSQVLSHLGTF